MHVNLAAGRRALVCAAVIALTASTSVGARTAREPAAAASRAPNAALSAGQLDLRQVASGLSAPLGIVNAGDGTDRLFILEKGGTVRVFADGALQAGDFLDLGDAAGGLTTDGERGLLGLAFDPAFETNRTLFVYYTDGGGDIVIGQLTANAAGTAVDAGTLQPMLHIEHSARSNHNGGQLLIGPDGYLYAFVGDGGGGGDPDENAQNPDSLLGKALRIAPDLEGGYDIPAGNPYAGMAGRDEIWAIGLRNPWRASFDRATGALWIADVGQGSWEEINRDTANAAGRNYGWDCREGRHPFEATDCSGLTFTDPIVEYGHGAGDCSVTGGYVYRGSLFPNLVGTYVLGDFCSGRLWTLDAAAGSPSLVLQQDTPYQITSFGESEAGELYLTEFGGGRLLQLVTNPFSDIGGSPFVDSIVWIYAEGITLGCGGGRYCPLEFVTREQMASFLARALSLPSSSTDFFTDDETSLHEADINRLAAAGITLGCGASRYCPLEFVTREQMASFLARALSLPSSSTDFFTDDEASPHEADINRLAAAGITLGCGGGRYCAADFVTREQMAAFLERALR
ncbi:MAG TPA: PQQ-dependent sugar dehydrogenase [Candidatus Limnocylindria bacterium]|nr:PQQ-dependent sugar dehydrogenase [Candidatus Limnocylindria bacterium]